MQARRQPLFDKPRATGIPGLATATAAQPGDRLAAVLDIAMLGGAGDGKTQFIVQAARTLGATSADVEDDELMQNREVLEDVMNAGNVAPRATRPGAVTHSVFRVAPEVIESGVGLRARIGLYMRAGGLSAMMLLTVLASIAAAAGVSLVLDQIDARAIAAGVATLFAGTLVAWLAAARSFRERGDVEIAFWDVAGEHVLGDSAAAYYQTLEQLTRARQWCATEWRPYAFAPVLVCNPLRLGDGHEGSRFHRLRQLLPMFARLGNGHALVAVNRWSVVELACRPDTSRDQTIYVRAYPRGASAEDTYHVTRDVVRRACLDAEDGRGDGCSVTHLRYEAGIRCAVEATGSDDATYDYVYDHGPCAFGGASRSGFLRWIARLAYRDARPGDGCQPPMPRNRSTPNHDDDWQPHGDDAERTLDDMTSVAGGRSNRRIEIVR